MNREYKPKLSICIATYNRANFIGQTLDSIFKQNTSLIEIIVVDGGSTDGTGDVVNVYRKRFKNFKYVNLCKKGGFDQDYSYAISIAAGDYCWFFSDDDIIKPDAFKLILDHLESNYDALIINAEILDSNLLNLLKPSCLKIKENTVYNRKNFEDLFTKTASHLSFIGSLIIKRSIWNRRNKESYFGTLFVHVGVFFQSIANGDILLVSKPLVSIRYGNAMWSIRSFEISMIIWPSLIWGFNKISNKSKEIVIKRNPWESIGRLLLFRAKGAYSLSEYHTFLRDRMSLFKRVFAFCAAITPGKFLNFVFFIYFHVMKNILPNARLHLLDIKNSKFYFLTNNCNK